MRVPHPGRSPGSTCGLPVRRGQGAQHSERTRRQIEIFLPVFRSGRRATPWPRSIHSQRSVSISERRAPVRISSRKAAMARQSSAVVRRGVHALQSTPRAGPARSPSGASALPLALFPPLRLRGVGPVLGGAVQGVAKPGQLQPGQEPLAMLLGYFSTCRHGLVPSGRSPTFSAQPKMEERSASARLAAMGLDLDQEWKRATSVLPISRTLIEAREGRISAEQSLGFGPCARFVVCPGHPGDQLSSKLVECGRYLAGIALGSRVLAISDLAHRSR